MITPEQYHAMLARLERNNLRDPKQLFDQAGQPPTVASESAHREKSAGRPDPESKLHDSIIEWANSQWPRMKFIHARMDQRSTIAVGAPDFVLFLLAGRVLCVECKAKGKKPTPEQLAWHKEMEMLGHKVHVVWSMDDFMKLVNALCNEEPI